MLGSARVPSVASSGVGCWPVSTSGWRFSSYCQAFCCSGPSPPPSRPGPIGRPCAGTCGGGRCGSCPRTGLPWPSAWPCCPTTHLPRWATGCDMPRLARSIQPDGTGRASRRPGASPPKRSSTSCCRCWRCGRWAGDGGRYAPWRSLVGPRWSQPRVGWSRWLPVGSTPPCTRRGTRHTRSGSAPAWRWPRHTWRCGRAPDQPAGGSWTISAPRRSPAASSRSGCSPSPARRSPALGTWPPSPPVSSAHGWPCSSAWRSCS